MVLKRGRQFIARAACFCKMLVKNRFQPARPAGRPAGRPRANDPNNYRFWHAISKWNKWVFPEPITSSVRDFEATFFTSPISIASACSSGRPLFARLRRPALLVLMPGANAKDALKRGAGIMGSQRK